MLLLIAANSWLQKTVLQGRNDAGLIITALIAAALPIALSGIGQGQNNGNQRADLYAGSMIGGSMLGLAGMWMLSHSYHATGALLGMIWLPTAQALPFFLISRFYSREIQKFSAVSLRKSQIKKNSKYLLSFGVLSISAGAIIPAALIAVRLMIEKNGDSSTLGLWQATTRISEAYTQLPLLILSVMLFARFASNASRPLSKKILLQTYTFMIGLMAVISISVLTLKSYWISIIFTPAFQGMSNFLPWQIAGDFARVLSYVGTTILAARGHVRLCVLGEVVQGLMLVSISHFFIPTLGSLAPFYAYILTYCIYLMLTLLLLRAKIKE